MNIMWKFGQKKKKNSVAQDNGPDIFQKMNFKSWDGPTDGQNDFFPQKNDTKFLNLTHCVLPPPHTASNQEF